MNNQVSKSNSSDEIDLIELIRHLWDNRKLILKITGAFIALGLVIAITSPKQYKVEVRMLPESKSSTGGASALLRQFSGLGGFAMPLGEGADAIGPMLYPDVLKSTPFYLELLDHKVTYKTNDETLDITVFEYLNEYTKSSLLEIISKYTIKLPWTVLGWIRGNNKDEEKGNIPGQKHFIQITKEQFETIEGLMDRINASIDQKNGVISISTEFGNPYITAQIAEFSVNYLSDYITEYRIEKAKADLHFITERYKENEKEYLHTQKELAIFRDANRNVQSAAARTEEERLNNKYTLAFNVFNGLAQQLEQAKIKVQEETPVIKMLEPVKVPIERSKPRRSLILIVFAFLGGLIGIGYVISKFIWKNIKIQIQEK
ncbi:MAG: Wzz/FepE/Etk N-terminal domain-containing protein [Bacteroidales bacterium]|nr:Wzz/FepE/Etk N-terminal domain-containing protein [Bacteroidales bacterium]